MALPAWMAAMDSEDEAEPPACLESLFEALNCQICCSTMSTPMLAPACGHSFCSLCIRRYVESKAPHGECPSCRTKLAPGDLIKNQSLDQVIRAAEKLSKVLREKEEEEQGHPGKKPKAENSGVPGTEQRSPRHCLPLRLLLLLLPPCVPRLRGIDD